MERIVKIGIIGCGGIAEGKHLPSLAKIENVQVVAFCDLIIEKAEKQKEKYGTENAKVYTDYHELLKDKDIEVVHVLTPNRSHSFITVDALDAGKHVMCEKPMAINYAEAQKMVEAVKRSGKKLTIGYQSRHVPQNMYLKSLVEKGELGEIYFARCPALRRRGVPTWGVFLNKEEQGGGPLIDIGTHSLDCLLWIMDNYKPKMVVGNIYHKLNGQGAESGNPWGKWDPKDFTVEDSAFGFITMENGATIQLDASWALNYIDTDNPLNSTMVCGTKGGADTFNGLRVNFIKDNRQNITVTDFSVGGDAFYSGEGGLEPQELESRRWIDAVVNDTPTAVLPEQAACVTRILEAIYKSAETGKPVYFDT